VRNLSMDEMRPFDQPGFDLNNKTIMITGATGSFGTAFLNLIMQNFKPRRIILFSRDETKQHAMRLRFNKEQLSNLRFFIGDVRDFERLSMAMRNVNYVVHAAAMKHIDAAEYNPFECIRTNVFGAENVIRAAIANNVEKVVALSTDKAANPLNLYGASKLASDKIFISGNYLSGSKGTRFAVVRYGNVLGSRGSVVEVFKRMVEDGVESLPITDTRMSRFWITLEQATHFVNSCFAHMAGGEIFVPKIPSMMLTDLTEAMAPGTDTHILGIRAGEKLHESMIPGDESRMCYDIDDRFVLEPALDLPRPTIEERMNKKARKVPDGFEYTSDKNEEWLDIPTLRQLLAQQGMLPQSTADQFGLGELNAKFSGKK